MPAHTWQICQYVLSPISRVYAAIMALRRKAWTSGLLKTTKVPCPCISVGNIAWGGAGKTPLVDWLMQWAIHHKLTPVVLSRGYKAEINNPPLHVQAHHNAQEVGDEPLMLAIHHPKAHVIVDPHRRRAAAYAMQNVQADLFILDDGMQHIAMERDLECIVLRPDDLSKDWNKVIPRGIWREDATALSNADVFFIKTPPSTLHTLEPQIMKYLAPFNRPVFTYHLVATGLEPLNPQNTIHLRPQHTPYAIITGIGMPDQAIETICNFMGTQPEITRIYPDHHAFTNEDIAYMKNLKMPVICTSKDAARLYHRSIDFPLFALNVAVQFNEAFMTTETFPSWITAWWNQWKH